MKVSWQTCRPLLRGKLLGVFPAVSVAHARSCCPFHTKGVIPMTFVSLAEATRRLGIDVKTLHRWLAEAQISLHCHPDDGRKKGVSEEHLLVLARLHQRSLTPFCEVPSVPAASPVPDLAAALLTLPEQVSVLQAQIAALQGQVADLTRLIIQHCSEPLIPAVPAKPSRIRKPPAKPAASAPAKAKP